MRVLTRFRPHHQLEDADRAEPDRDHDAQRQEQAEQRVAGEAVLGERERRHGAEQQDQASETTVTIRLLPK